LCPASPAYLITARTGKILSFLTNFIKSPFFSSFAFFESFLANGVKSTLGAAGLFNLAPFIGAPPAGFLN